MPISSQTLKKLKQAGLTSSDIKVAKKLLVPKPKRLAMNTPLTKMGFDPALVKKLPSKVRKLKKADLMSLGDWTKNRRLTPAAAKLSFKEVQSIREVLGTGGLNTGPANLAMDIYCCCCPCCCAIAVNEKATVNKSESFLVSA